MGFDNKSLIILAQSLVLILSSGVVWFFWRRSRNAGHGQTESITALTGFQRQLDCFPLPAYLWRADGGDLTLIGYNSAAVKFTDGAIKNIYGSSAKKLYCGDDAVLAALSRAYAERTTFSVEAPYQLRSTGLTKQLRTTYSHAADDYIIVYTEDLTERHNAMQNLQVSQNRLRASLDSSHDPMYMLEMVTDAKSAAADFLIIDVNLAALKLSPHRRHEVIGCRLSEAFPEFCERGFDKDYLQAFQTQQPVDWEYETVAADGSTSWYCHRVVPTTTGLILTDQDITKWKSAAREAQKKNQELSRLKNLINLSSEAIHMSDAAGNLVYVNAAAAKRFGIEADECHKYSVKSYSEIFRSEGAWERNFESLRKLGKMTRQGRHFDQRTGASYAVEVTANYVKVDDQEFAVAISRDISASKALENKLKASGAQLRGITDNLPVLICQIDNNLQFQFVNREVLKFTGKSREQLLTMRLPQIAGDETFRQAQPYLDRALAGDMVEFEQTIYDGAGQPATVWIQLIPTKDAQGNQNGFIGLLQNITERKLAEMRLRESQQRYQSVVDASQDAIVIHQDNKIVFVNNACVSLMRAAHASDLIGKSPLDLVHPDFRALAQQRIRKVQVENESVPLVEEKFIRFDGTIVEAEVSASQISFDGRPASLLVARDLTARRRAEGQIRLLNTSIANINDIVLITEAHPLEEPGPRIVFVNQAFEKITGYTQNEVIGQSPRMLQGPLTDRHELRRIKAALLGQKPIRTQLINYRKDGSHFWLEVDISPIFSENGECTHFISIERDITHRITAEAERNASMQHIANLERALSAHALVAITDVHGRITYANDKFVEVSKYSRTELIGQDHRILNSGYHSKSFMRDLWHTIKNGQIWKSEIRNRAKDGTLYWVDTTIMPMTDQDGKITEFISIRTEISERVKYQKMINELNIDLTLKADELEKANESLESFAYSVAHDLRAPLRGIDGWSLALSEDYAERLDDQAVAYVNRIRADAQKMADMIDVFLRLVRVTHDKLRPRDFNFSALAEEISLKLRKEYPDRQLTFLIEKNMFMFADEQFIEIALMNLMQNAVKFSREKTEAKIELGFTDSDSERVFFIRDNGIGFSTSGKEEVGKIFRRRHNAAAYPGTGVGLTIVRRVIDRHGGRVWVESRPGEGTTYFFTVGSLAAWG